MLVQVPGKTADPGLGSFVRVDAARCRPTGKVTIYRGAALIDGAVTLTNTGNGTLGITVEGTQAGDATSVDLAQLAGGRKEVPFNFRYYQTIEQPLTLPADFKPDRVTIEVRPARKGVAPYRRTFVWTAALS